MIIPPAGCGETVVTNNTYFTSTDSPASPCLLSVCRAEDNVCQLRLDFQVRVELSHWSRSHQILGSHWWTPLMSLANVYAITTHPRHKMSPVRGLLLALSYIMISGPYIERTYYGLPYTIKTKRAKNAP